LTRFDALEDVDDLLFAEPGLAHDGFSSSVSLRENSHYRCTSFRGGGQPALAAGRGPGRAREPLPE
ncbi:MAG TPA: hypothetical protein VF611_08330, partial [Pyrinomonadaceae bacterium]